jgi:thiol-disulfide isomerase/thioredoxin
MDQLQSLMHEPGPEIRVVNFWATWCAPCVKELPLFEALSENRKDVDVLLVSLDLDLDPNPDKVYKFVERKQLQSRVVLLDEKDPNVWINRVDSQWSGAIPATIILNLRTGQRKFIGRQLHEGELDALIKELQ